MDDTGDGISELFFACRLCGEALVGVWGGWHYKQACSLCGSLCNRLMFVINMAVFVVVAVVVLS